MKKISFETAFQSYFHNKYSFSDLPKIQIDSHYTEIFHSKNTFSPSKELKQYQKFLNHFLFDFLDINKEVVFSYRKDTNITDALIPHTNKKYIFTSDIKSFFKNINTEIVKKILIDNKSNFLILEEDIIKYIDLIINLITYNDILPVGAPTSPIISNAYLYDFDNIILDYCKDLNISYTRYSDDFIFSSDNKTDLSSLEDKLITTLNELYNGKLEINSQKNKIFKRGNKITILGLVITPQGAITIDKKLKNDIETLLYFYISDRDKFNNFFEKKYDSDINKVSGKLSYIYSIDIEYIDKLKRKYGSYLVNSFIHRNIIHE